MLELSQPPCAACVSSNPTFACNLLRCINQQSSLRDPDLVNPKNSFVRLPVDQVAQLDDLQVLCEIWRHKFVPSHEPSEEFATSWSVNIHESICENTRRPRRNDQIRPVDVESSIDLRVFGEFLFSAFFEIAAVPPYDASCTAHRREACACYGSGARAVGSRQGLMFPESLSSGGLFSVRSPLPRCFVNCRRRRVRDKIWQSSLVENG